MPKSTGQNAAFKKIYDSMVAFRGDAFLWQQFSEYTFDAFMMGQQRKKTISTSMSCSTTQGMAPQ
jgi:hypothetical protein